MNFKDGRLPIPATVEFLARCARVAGRRFISWRERAADTPSPVAAVDRSQLADALARLDIRPGAVLMVHSDTSEIARMGWQPSDMIDFLLDYLGPDGTLAMPTHPKLFERNGKRIYDVRRSPSRVGLLTELFRRRKNVERSRCPFSAAAAIGPRAHELLDEHGRSFAPHDEHSPYAKLAALDGVALCIGTSLDRMTILHVAEDVLREKLPIAGFHEPQKVWVKDGAEEYPLKVHTRADWLWWYLCLYRWAYDMYHQKLARNVYVSGVAWRAADARPTVEWMQREVERGRTLYPLAWMNRYLRLGRPRLEPDE